MEQSVCGFGYRGSTRLFVEDAHWVDWVLAHQGQAGFTKEDHYGLGEVVQYEWRVGEDRLSVPPSKWSFVPAVLPDGSGFIGFEPTWSPDNCVLLDAYGRERMRLTVPWQMTGSKDPASGRSPTSFALTSAPSINPKTGQPGAFGVTAWVELAGMYYFELDYHTGEFLWCRQIRD